jgi:dTDP-4-dehydrorhamnose 3,5-epimerase
MWVPEGFAHGFCTLEANCLVSYKVTAFYSAQCDAGLFWNDPALSIAWPVRQDQAVVSGKDRELPRLANLQSPFFWQG